MKSVYDLSEKELKKTGKEFNKTGYGRRMLNLRNGSIFISVLAVLIYGAMFSINENNGFEHLLHEGFLWLVVLVGTILEFICHLKYNQALKDYVEYKNKEQ